jgi:hypothetical protein
MNDHYSRLLRILSRVVRRWRALTALRAWTFTAAAIALVLALALVAQYVVDPHGVALVLLWGLAVIAASACLVWCFLTVRRVPDRIRVARYIEERCPELEDAFATAIARGATAVPDPMLAVVIDDALRRAEGLDLDRVVNKEVLRKGTWLAGAATAALLLLSVVAFGPARSAARLLGVYAFPASFAIDVTPGDVKVRAGSALRILARVPSAAAGVVPVLRVEDESGWHDAQMERAEDGFAVAFSALEQGFKYAVTAAGATSPVYTVTVVRPPRVERIELHYDYPESLGLPPRIEEDGGDIFGPAGTRVRIAVHADRPVASAAMTFASGPDMTLTSRGASLEGEMTISEDGSYRIALTDAEGLSNPGDTEYFIRTLEDRPPDVKIIRPASDREATPLEEVLVEARADDDFGVDSFEMVYSVRGEPEKVVPFQKRAEGLTVNGRRLIYLEDLEVAPGDFVAYYARARDISRGKQSSEGRSDIFFIEIKPFDAELQAGQSQGASGETSSVGELVEAQKEIIAATWKLDRRGRDAGGSSREDIATVANAQGELRGRVEDLAQESSATRNAGRGGRGRGAMPARSTAENPLSLAAEAMGRAEQQLRGLSTTRALPHEMTALNELMRAEAESRRQQMQQQANASGRGSNRRQQDLSSLFDQELARQQQTNYETPNSSESQDEPEQDDALDEIRELARRQEALNREEQGLAKNRQSLSAEEFRRQLEQLAREQNALRQQAEEISRQMQQRGRQGGQGQSGQGQSGQSRSGQGQSQSGQAQSAEANRSLREASQQMQDAANELRKQNPAQASASGSRAAEQLRGVEQRLRAALPDDRTRAIGELQLESQQLADEQRRLARETTGAGRGESAGDAARRLGGEQERLATRTERLERSIRELAAGVGPDGSGREEGLTAAARDVDRQRLSERMRGAARAERELAGERPGTGDRPREVPGPGATRGEAIEREQQDIARGLDRLSERLGAANEGDEQARRLTEELSRVRELRDRLTAQERELTELARGGERAGQQGPNGDGESASEGQAQAGGERGRGGRSGQRTNENTNSSTPGGGGNQTGEPWQSARELLDEIRREEIAGLRSEDIEGFNPGRSAPGTEPWKQDFAQWEELKEQLVAALERAETTAAAKLREQQMKDRLNAGTTQAVPEQYRQLVDKYYRSLAAGSVERR